MESAFNPRAPPSGVRLGRTQQTSIRAIGAGEAVPRAGSAALRVKVILALRDAPQAPLSVHLDSCAPPPRSRTLRAREVVGPRTGRLERRHFRKEA